LERWNTYGGVLASGQGDQGTCGVEPSLSCMSRHERSNHESLLLSLAILAAAFVFAAAVNDRAVISNDEAVITRLQISLSQRPSNEAKMTRAPSVVGSAAGDQNVVPPPGTSGGAPVPKPK
jgi:hypothetical protein